MQSVLAKSKNDLDQLTQIKPTTFTATPRFVTTNKQVLLRRLCFPLKGFLLPLIPLCVYLYVLFLVLYLLYIYIKHFHDIQGRHVIQVR